MAGQLECIRALQQELRSKKAMVEVLSEEVAATAARPAPR